MLLMKNWQHKENSILIADPPYGINAPKMCATKNARKKGDKRLNRGGGKLKNRVLNTSSIAWDNEIPSDEYFSEIFKATEKQIIWGGNYFPLRPTRCVLCWDKVQPWENFSQIELAWTSFDSPAQLFRFDNRTGDKIHPTQKPVQLYAWLISKYVPKGSIILDTHVGSGTIMQAVDMANKLEHMDLTFYGTEIDESSFEKAVKRFKDYAKSPLILFPE